MRSDKDDSPEKGAQIVPSALTKSSSTRTIKGYQPLAEHNSTGSDKDGDKVKERYVSDASRSKGSKKREPISITPDILLLLDILALDKEKLAKRLIEHPIGQWALPSTEEELLYIPVGTKKQNGS
jgi:hypothetical protein